LLLGLALATSACLVTPALNNLGQVYGSPGQDSEAEPLYKRAFAIFEKTGGLDSVDVALLAA
jgi:hypothetical protein